jgi:hypothetical protein
MAQEVIEQDATTDIPEDYAAFEAFRNAGGGQASTDEQELPAAGKEDTPSSEQAAIARQIAAESGTGEEAQQDDAEEEEEELEDEKPAGKPNKGIERRMRKLTGEITALKSQLADRGKPPAEVAEEAEAEVVSATEEVEAVEEAAAPMLRDFEDNEDESAWDQYEKATKAFNKAETAKAIQTALEEQRTQLNLEHAKAAAAADWDKAASRFPDFKQVMEAAKDVQINAAMEAVMRMDPEAGTEIAVYLAGHPEESVRIAKLTLATNQQELAAAMARAGMELGLIRAKLTSPGRAAPPKVTPTAATPPKPKTVTSASKPPTQIRGGSPPAPFDILNDEDAKDTAKWLKERDKQLAASGKR